MISKALLDAYRRQLNGILRAAEKDPEALAQIDELMWEAATTGVRRAGIQVRARFSKGKIAAAMGTSRANVGRRFPLDGPVESVSREHTRRPPRKVAGHAGT